MGSEDFALTRWDDWTTGGDPPPAPPPDYKPHPLLKSSSRNHPGMIDSTYALGAAIRGATHAGARAAIEGCRANLGVQRENGLQDQEGATGYGGFHAGVAAAMALAGKAWYQITGEADLWLEAVGHAADRLAVYGALRVANGEVLDVGARVHPDQFNHASNGVFEPQIFDPLPHHQLTQWMQRLFTPGGGRGADRTGGLAAPGWAFRRYSWTRMLLLARTTDALPAAPLRRLAHGRRPRLLRPLYRWSSGGWENAAMPEIKGLGPRQWWCRWRGGVMEYPSGEKAPLHGEPGTWLLPGRGPHKSPTRIPIPGHISPLFRPDSPIPPLPTLADLGEDAGSPPPPKDEEEPMESHPIPRHAVERWLTKKNRERLGGPLGELVWQAGRLALGEPHAKERLVAAYEVLERTSRGK